MRNAVQARSYGERGSTGGGAMRSRTSQTGPIRDSASNGEEGLRKVKEFRPDLIILDIMMDGDTEGFHVAYKLRTPDPEYAAYSGVPILMLTGIGKAKGMDFSPEADGDFLPADDFVEKSISPRVLLQKVLFLLPVLQPAGKRL